SAWLSELAASERRSLSSRCPARRRTRRALQSRQLHRRLFAQPRCLAPQQRFLPSAHPHPESGSQRQEISRPTNRHVLDALAHSRQSTSLHATRPEARAENALLRRQLVLVSLADKGAVFTHRSFVLLRQTARL